jgi:hypothetical protein
MGCGGQARDDAAMVLMDGALPDHPLRQDRVHQCAAVCIGRAAHHRHARVVAARLDPKHTPRPLPYRRRRQPSRPHLYGGVAAILNTMAASLAARLGRAAAPRAWAAAATAAAQVRTGGGCAWS